MGENRVSGAKCDHAVFRYVNIRLSWLLCSRDKNLLYIHEMNIQLYDRITKLRTRYTALYQYIRGVGGWVKMCSLDGAFSWNAFKSTRDRSHVKSTIGKLIRLRPVWLNLYTITLLPHITNASRAFESFIKINRKIEQCCKVNTYQLTVNAKYMIE